MPGVLERKVSFTTGAGRGQGRAHAVMQAVQGVQPASTFELRRPERTGGATLPILDEWASVLERLTFRGPAERADLATLFYSALLNVGASMAWDFIERYSRSEVHIFSVCVGERQEGDTRIVELADGSEVRERNVTVDAARMRAVYTVPGLPGVEHHQAEMRVVEEGDGTARLEWCTDVLPHDYADLLRDVYAPMFEEMIGAVNGQRPG
jgi:Polyketide cyclase / dehydrase and lipid transport